MLQILCLIPLIFQSAFPQSQSGAELLLTSEEVSLLNENEIRFAPHPSWPPGEFIDEQGEHKGIVADYINLFEEKLGISFHNEIYSNWREMLEGLENGGADFVGAMQKTEDREQYLLFTEPYIRIPNVILTRSDYPYRVSASHLNSMTLAGVSGYANVDYIRLTYPGAEIIEYDDDLTALLQTSLGLANGTVIDVMTASYLVEKYGISNLQLGMTLDYDWELRMASRKDLPELHSILNKLVESVDQQQREEIFNSWINIDLIQEAGFIERNQSRLIILFTVILLVAASITLHNYDLKKQVKEQTKDLKSSLDEKEILLSEIHHRVKNNLAITSSLLQLEMMQIEKIEVIEILSNSLMRIKSIALVHENLYETYDFKRIPFHTYLEDLITRISENFENGKEIQVEKDLQEVFLNINLAIPAALLVNELVSNAFKYAFKSRKKGTIKVSLSNREQDIVLIVEDNGIGLPDFVNLEDKSSVSFLLMNTLAKQLNAWYDIQTKPGTKFKFIFENADRKGSAGNIYPKQDSSPKSK
jgi:two-component sensor histidine kinase/ABC-type amino acid transport substrate-binding protein